MHVGLNLVYLVPDETGGRETYARCLIPRLAALGLRLTSFLNREAARDTSGPWHEAGEVVLVPASGRSRAQWAAGEQLLLPRLAANAGVEVLHSLANFAPAWGPFARVVTVHDLLYARHPEFLSPLMRAGTRTLLPLGVRRSDRVVAVSAASRDELTRLLGVPDDRIDVVPNGVELDPPQPTGEDELRSRLGLDRRRFALSVATHLPHKNLSALVDAAAAASPDARPLYVIAGSGTDEDGALAERARALGVEDHVRVLGRVSAADLEGLYRAAACLVVPSLYEGFGFPPVEAMARGVPVACADIPALREVAANAAVYFDPRWPEAIARAVGTLLADDDRRTRLSDAGPIRAQAFTWSAAARATVASYERALDQRRGRAFR
ncbi:MAG TPA: glycosyltransferase family 1 protein [Thermoleophilaceae bacterium]|nr:glycosyltransferase family 1 protein [Thermoleophilaceae bacterium]